MKRTAVCSQSADITLSCNASGELPVLHFRLWEHSYNGYVLRYLKGQIRANTSILYLGKCNYEDAGDYLCSASTRIENVDLLNNVSSKIVIKGVPIFTEKYIYKEPLLKLSVNIYAEPQPIHVCWFDGKDKIKNSTTNMMVFSKTLVERKIHGKLIKTIGFSANLTFKNILYVRKTFCILVQNEIGNASKTFVIEEEVSVSDSEFHVKDILWFLSGSIVLILISSVFAILFNSYRRGSRSTVYSDTMYNAVQATGLTVHQYDIPLTISNYEELESIQNDNRETGQQNEYEETDKEDLHESEDGYQIVHEYMEVI